VPRKVYPVQVNRLGKLLSYTLAFVLCYSQLVASAHFVEHLPHQNQGNDRLGSHSALHAADQTALHSLHNEAGHELEHNVEHKSDQRIAKFTNQAPAHSNHPDLDQHQLDSHLLDSHHGASLAAGSPAHDERSIADCSIYHFYSALNGLVQARTDTPCSSFDHVITVATRATPHQQTFAHHQPIRAPPLFS